MVQILKIVKERELAEERTVNHKRKNRRRTLRNGKRGVSTITVVNDSKVVVEVVKPVDQSNIANPGASSVGKVVARLPLFFSRLSADDRLVLLQNRAVSFLSPARNVIAELFDEAAITVDHYAAHRRVCSFCIQQLRNYTQKITAR